MYTSQISIKFLALGQKKNLCFRDFAEYLFWNLKDFLYSEILKTAPPSTSYDNV